MIQLIYSCSKPQEMVSVRLVHAIANKKGAVIVVIDTSQTINKQMFVIDAITESLVCRISLCSLRSLTTINEIKL